MKSRRSVDVRNMLCCRKCVVVWVRSPWSWTAFSERRGQWGTRHSMTFLLRKRLFALECSLSLNSHEDRLYNVVGNFIFFAFFTNFCAFQKNATLAGHGLLPCSSSTTTTRLTTHRYPQRTLILFNTSSSGQEENASQESWKNREKGGVGTAK